VTTGSKWGIGDKVDAKAFDTTTVEGRIVELVFGEHPHSRSDNNMYARDPMSGQIHDFDGHRRLIDVRIESSNYLKESSLSGDEVRKSVSGTIFSDGTQVYEFGHRDPAAALLMAHGLVVKLGEHESGWLNADNRMRMPGRKIYYHEIPATIVALIEEQGCVMISTEPGIEPTIRGQDAADLWEDCRDGDHYTVKDDVLSPHIWWWRDE
jgi:hypothetical protein